MKTHPHGPASNYRAALLALAAMTVLSLPVAAQDGVWESWSSDSYTLEPRESFQFHVVFDQIPVRSWKLLVEGARDVNCDLTVLRVKGESLLYYKTKESRHEVIVPWGVGEEVIVVVTNRNQKGAFVIDLLGPPRDQIHAAYSYHVNRALDAYASGRRLEAEAECEKAIRADENDGVAKVLLAGFLRNRQYYGKATVMVEQALADDLPDDMRGIAEDLRAELARLRAPLPEPISRGVAAAKEHLADGNPERALTVCDDLLAGDLELDPASKSQLQQLRGEALDQLDRNFEAVDAFTQALQLNRNRADEAVIYFHMGQLFFKMENLLQARGSYTMALENGLPSGLELQAREALQLIEDRLVDER